MVSLPRLLRRFRGHPVPGAPAVLAVPVDTRTRAEAELASVFDALEDAQRAAAGIMTSAQTDAVKRRDDSIDAARKRMTRARREAAAARTRAAAAVLARGDAECQLTMYAAHVEADRVTRVGRERMPRLVEEVVRRALVLGELDPGLRPTGPRPADRGCSAEEPYG